MVIRTLGPIHYGDFNFLTNFFSRIFTFFDAGTSNGFYIKLSQRKNDHGLITFYVLYMLFISIIVALATGIIYSNGLYYLIFPNQKNYFISLALIYGILAWFLQIFEKMADAYGITIQSEFIKLCQKILGFITVIILFISHKLNLTNYFYYNFFIMLILIVSLLWYIISKRHIILNKLRFATSKTSTYIKEFYNYGHPLFVHVSVGLIVNIFDKWLLQYFYGSTEQGVFWLSFKISTICMIFTTAMSHLIMREFSITFNKNNIDEMRNLFKRYIPLLFSIATFISCFIAIEANNITLIIAGENFQNATLTVMIMCLYPIYQTHSQLNSTVFYATAKTRLYRNIQVTTNIIRLPLIYFLLAPKEMFGLYTGSIGLAALFVLVAFINSNVQLYFNLHFLKIRFWRFSSHQILCIASMACVAILAKFSVANFLGFQDKVIYSFLSSGLLYSITVMALIYIQPGVFGLKKNDIQNFANIIKR